MPETPERLAPKEGTHYSPGEYAEAFAKADQREQGTKEAKFYGEFLEGLRDKVKFQARRLDLNKKWEGEDVKTRWATHKIKEFEFLDQEAFGKAVKESLDKANRIAGTQTPSVEVKYSEVGEMTPNQFFAYTRQLDASLIGAEPPKKVPPKGPTG